MPFDGGPPLHPSGITSESERAKLEGEYSKTVKGQPFKFAPEEDPDYITTAKLDAEVTERLTDNAINAGKLTRFPTYHLEPFQLQRAQALERAVAMLPDSMIEDQLRAAHYIETGHIPDA